MPTLPGNGRARAMTGLWAVQWVALSFVVCVGGASMEMLADRGPLPHWVVPVFILCSVLASPAMSRPPR